MPQLSTRRGHRQISNPLPRGFRPDSVIEIRHVFKLLNGRLILDGPKVEHQRSSSSGNKRPKRRTSRAVAIDALEMALTEHIIAARDHAHAAIARGECPELLPRPDQKFLAAELNLSASAVSRALKDPNAHTLRMLWELAGDLEQVLKY